MMTRRALAPSFCPAMLAATWPRPSLARDQVFPDFQCLAPLRLASCKTREIKRIDRPDCLALSGFGRTRNRSSSGLLMARLQSSEAHSSAQHASIPAFARLRVIERHAVVPVRCHANPCADQPSGKRGVPRRSILPAVSGGKYNRPKQLVAVGAAPVCTCQEQAASAGSGQRPRQWTGGLCAAPCSTRWSAHARVGRERDGASIHGVLSKQHRLDTSSAPAR
jgi:hypothetical protein